MLRLNKTKPFAIITPPREGANFVQGGHYYDGLGNLIYTKWSPPADQTLATHNGAAEPSNEDLGPIVAPVLVFSPGHDVVDIDGVRYIRSDALLGTALRMAPDAPSASPQPPEVGQPFYDYGPEGAPVAAAPPVAAVPALGAQALAETDDDLTRIKGIGPVSCAKLRDLGLTTFASIAALATDEIAELEEALGNKGIVARENWVSQAAALLADKHPERVRRQDPEEKPKSELTIEDLVAWAKREGQKRPWPTVRKAFADLLSVKIMNETDGVAILLRDGHLKPGEEKL